MKLAQIKRIADRGLTYLPFPQFKDDYELPGGYKRIYHYHVRKTAGSAINQVFYNIAGDGRALVEKIWTKGSQRLVAGDYVFIGHNRHLIDRGDYFFGAAHYPAHELNLKPETYTITSLRDPLDRIVSHFRMLHDYNKQVPKHPALRKKKEGLFLKDTLDEFLEVLPRQKLLNQIFMFSRELNVEEALESLMGVNTVVMMQDFNAGISKLAKDLDFKLEASRANVTKSQLPIEQSSLDKARELLQPEYDLLVKLAQSSIDD